MAVGRDRPDDEELVAMVAEGRPEALAALYDRYAAACYGLALRILGDREDAEEAVQDAFVALWRRAGTYDPGQGRAYSWMLRIARNKAIDGLRRGGPARRPRQVPQGMPDLAREPGSVEEEADTAELRLPVAGALERLPQDQREVLEMAYLGGLSQREIAESTGVPLGTVKTRTRLALRKLREALRPLFSKKPVDPHGL